MRINVLSLCGGIETGRVALEELGYEIDNYYSSEIDLYKISINRYNFGDKVKDVGGITELDEDFLKTLPKIDLILSGTPCTNLSSVNVYARDGLNGEESRLFFEFVRILEWIKENNNLDAHFLFENVGSMKNEEKDKISKVLHVDGVPLNSSILSAQNRNRVYWTNIKFEVPKQRKELYMRDILEKEVDDKYYLTEKMYKCVMSKGTKGWQTGKLEIDLDIARPLLKTMHKMHRADTDNYISTEYRPIDKTNVRRLTPLECERLQTLPDDFTKYGINDKGKKVIISDTRRYMATGDGWTKDVIKYILGFMKL